MKQYDLLELAKEGKLILEKYIRTTKIRSKYIYDKTQPLYLPNGELNEKALEIIEVKQIPYKVWTYKARTTDMGEDEWYILRKDSYKQIERLMEEIKKSRGVNN